MGSFDQKPVVGPPQWPVGSIIQCAGVPIASVSLPGGPGVLPTIAGQPDPAWLLCDGSPIQRAQYPKLSNSFGGSIGPGTFTGTIRTLASTPQTNTIASNGTTIVASGSSTAAQVSSNSGVTWSAPTMAASINVQALNWNGTVYVAGPSGAQVCQYSTVGTGTWTVCTGAVSGVTGLASNTSNGAMVLVDSATGSVWSSPSSAAAAPAFVTSALASGSLGAAMSKTPVVYSGTQFILFSYQAVGQGYQVSTAGLTGTWTANPNPPWGMAVIIGAASDGANNVLAVIAGSSVAYKSNDGGSTWKRIILPGVISNTGNTLGSSVSYANGRFFVTLINMDHSTAYSDGSMAVSSDLKSWAVIPSIGIDQSASTAIPTQVSYQGGNYVFINTINSTCVTATENLQQMYLPVTRGSLVNGSTVLLTVGTQPQYIRCQ